MRKRRGKELKEERKRAGWGEKLKGGKRRGWEMRKGKGM